MKKKRWKKIKVENTKLTVDDVARVFGVPPHLLNVIKEDLRLSRELRENCENLEKEIIGNAINNLSQKNEH